MRKRPIELPFEKVESRFDKQDDTLRLIWRLIGGSSSKHLPTDDRATGTQ